MRRLNFISSGPAAAVLLAWLAGPGLAGEAQDRIFAMGALHTVENGSVLVYDYDREGSFPTDKMPVIDAGHARLEMTRAADGTPEVTVALDDTKHVQKFDPFSATAGNPMFMVFMEQNVASMSAVTGGSPFYIRNRMREALGAQDSVTPIDVEYGGATVPAREIVFRPFEKDAKRDRMGAFADLEIRFVMSDAVPGEFLRMESRTGPGPDGAPLMRLSMDLDHVEKAK